MAWELGLVGSAISWGSRWAPSANGPLRLRALGLAGRLKAAGVPARWHHVIEAPPFNPAEAASAEIPIRRVATQCRAVRAAVASALSDGLFPVTLGGDHSAALGHYAALASRLGERGRLGILWIDAHADLNTVDTSPSGNVHGMPLAAILGHGDPRLTSVMAGGRVAPEDIHLLALRDVDRPEWEFIQAHGIRVTGMDAIRREGLAACLARAIEGFGPGIGGLGVSLDLDALTGAAATEVATPVPGGLDPAETRVALAGLAARPELMGLEVAEYAPPHPDGQGGWDPGAAFIADLLADLGHGLADRPTPEAGLRLAG